MRHFIIPFLSLMSLCSLACEDSIHRDRPEAVKSTVPDKKATCYGAANCSACKDCKDCEHCAKDSGKCGACQ